MTSAFDELAAGRPSHHATVDQRCQDELAGRRIETPQALRLLARHTHSRHLTVFTRDAAEEIVKSRRFPNWLLRRIVGVAPGHATSCSDHNARNGPSSAQAAKEAGSSYGITKRITPIKMKRSTCLFG